MACLRQQSGTKIGVLVAITGQGPIPPVGGTPRHRSGGHSTPHHYYNPRGSESPYPVAFHPRTRGAMPPGKSMDVRKSKVKLNKFIADTKFSF
ncbi:hypothetical protein AVEN_275307-1 [Araneus ventricosus]|uniref:Uncharacterized protein n=1 Tax=Araneus ventricosus TaxID=182803 RepID=A0A4Y2GEX2_ARAVE|nr:hypothetical protein AVEN_275307-1 [Araneus ventricosus]